MNGQLYRVDNKHMRRYANFFRGAPIVAGRACADVLTEMAIKSRLEAQNVIRRRLTSRSPGILRAGLRYKKAHARTNLNKIKSEMFSISKDNFTGWEEQVEGGKVRRGKRTYTKFSRGGKNKARVRPKYRAGKKFLTPDDLDKTKAHAKSDHHLALVMLMWMKRKKGRRQPFMLYGHRRIQPGVYIWARREGLKQLQSFSTPPATPHLDWPAKAAESMLVKNSIQSEWNRAFTEEFKRARKNP